MSYNLANFYCISPFMSIHIEHDGMVSLCPCPGWGKTQIGNILETKLEDMLSSEHAVNVRQSIIDGSYQFCDKKKCGIIVNKSLNTFDSLPPNVKKLIKDSKKFSMPYEIMMNGDRTCNLACPSCRTGVVKLNDNEVAQQNRVGSVLYQNLFSTPTNDPILLSLSGSGEVFASLMLLNFLEKINLSDFPNLKINLHTNGLLAEQRWHRIEHLEPAIDKIFVSIDGATKATYEKVRLGGAWEDMLTALEFFKNKKQRLNFRFMGRMIFQTSNYQEAREFYDLCKSYNIDRIEYSRLTNWGTWNGVDFMGHDVLYYKHPKRDEAILLVQQLKNLPDVWFEGNFN